MNQRELPRPALPVGDLLTAAIPGLILKLLAGSGGLKRPITSPVVQKPGLALAGRAEGLKPGTVQVLGRDEVAYVAGLTEPARRDLLERVVRGAAACFIVSHGAAPHGDLANATDRAAIPLLGTSLSTARLMEALGRHLEERLAPEIALHGTLMDIYGVGVLMLGESGVGKSESALELIMRGHRLVADDTVTLRRLGAVLNGTGPEVSRYHMELRGLGIINIKDLYGVAAVRERKDVELVIRLDPWQEGKEYERLGLEERTWNALGVAVPTLEMPVAPGRNLSILLEVAARHHLLKRRGYHPAKELAGRIHEALGKKA